MTTLLRPHRNHKHDSSTIATGPATPGLSVHRTPSDGDPRVGLIGTLVLVAGLVLGMSGIATWAFVQNSLSDERITVKETASRFGGQDVNGPLTAYYQAQIIEKDALELSDGKTYAELDRTDPVRVTMMNGSFLRASLFTSVVSFGIAALAMGLGLVFVLIGLALRSIGRTVPGRS